MTFFGLKSQVSYRFNDLKKIYWFSFLFLTNCNASWVNKIFHSFQKLFFLPEKFPLTSKEWFGRHLLALRPPSQAASIKSVISSSRQLQPDNVPVCVPPHRRCICAALCWSLQVLRQHHPLTPQSAPAVRLSCCTENTCSDASLRKKGFFF